MEIEKDVSGAASIRGAGRHFGPGTLRRRGALRTPSAKSGVAIAGVSPARNLELPRSAVVKAVRTRVMGRKFAMWYLFGALWVSIGMIVSATLMAFVFLA